MFDAVILEHDITQVVVRARVPQEVREVALEVPWKMVLQYLKHELLEPDAVELQGSLELWNHDTMQEVQNGGRGGSKCRCKA